ncbi:MAG: DUF1289 domain-containing protein [Burkholderiaceae bacterium]|nr:DUF1289 domain-containing protein [Burkholderiaceae bacterium]
MDAASGLCAGCFRTLDEIAQWGTMAEDARQQVWEEITRRRAVAGHAVRPTPPPGHD